MIYSLLCRHQLKSLVEFCLMEVAGNLGAISPTHCYYLGSVAEKYNFMENIDLFSLQCP